MIKHLIILLIFTSCHSSNQEWIENYTSINCQMKILEKKINGEISNSSKQLLKQKEFLEKDLSDKKNPYLKDIQKNKNAIAEIESTYIKKLREVKADHFSKYGHKVENAELLDKAIEIIGNEKNIKRDIYRQKIKDIESALGRDSIVAKRAAELEAVVYKIENIKIKIKNQYQLQTDSINDIIKILEDERRVKLKSMDGKEKDSFLRIIDSLAHTPCISTF